MVVASTAAAACGAWLYHLDSWYEEAKHERASYEWCVGRCACEGRRVGGWEEAVVVGASPTNHCIVDVANTSSSIGR
jgi:hypothetical protein